MICKCLTAFGLVHCESSANLEKHMDSQLPRATVTLPPDGPPAMSPRARRAARRLSIPLQALPIPVNGKRITEKDVLSAAHARAAIPMTAAARKLVGEHGADPSALARKLGRRLHADDVAQLTPVALRLPAERIKLTPQELDTALQATRTVREIPQLSMEAFILAGPLLAHDTEPAAYWVRALAMLLADETFKRFRAVLDGDELVYRGQINIAYIVHSAETSKAYQIPNVEKLSVRQLSHFLSEAQHVNPPGGGALITLLDLSQLPVDTARIDITSGQSAVMTMSALQSRVMHNAALNEWRFEKGWNLHVAADARVIGADLLGFFISRLKSLLDNPSVIV
jgi:pyruvate/2-oxoglutarate dehydrogenase complex dihydrolipoamide acyltransferase (E2) component